MTYDEHDTPTTNLTAGAEMTGLVERLRRTARVDRGDGVAELVEEASREIERLRLLVIDLEQRVDSGRVYSSSDWPDDA